MADAGTKRSCVIWSIRRGTNRWIFAEVDCTAFCSPDTEGGRLWFTLMSCMSIFYSHPSLPGQAPIDHQRCAPMPDSRMLVTGKIQGGGRRFLNHFKSYFGSQISVKSKRDGRKFRDRFKSTLGSQISSQSLNEANIYRLQPKSATKCEFCFCFVFIYFCLWFFESVSQIANGERSRRSAAR